MKPNYKARRLVVLLCVAIVSLSVLAYDMAAHELSVSPMSFEQKTESEDGSALKALQTLPVKGKAPKTGYTRTQFSNGWELRGECDMRNIILRRDMVEVQMNEDCKVLSGVLEDPYTGTRINFTRGASTSDDVQIDHVVALSNAWQTGAQLLNHEQRQAFANDPLNLIAADGTANQQKSDGDAATWLPPNKSFRCQYVARQIAVKQAYSLWVTPAELGAIENVLEGCPKQSLPVQ